MTNILSRHHINPEILIHHWDIKSGETTTFDYRQLCDMIDYWKYMLVEGYHAQPGKTVMIEFNLTNIYYFSAIYAAWELGLTLIVDWVHANSEQMCHSKVFSIHGKIDYAIVYSRQLDPSDKDFYSKWDVLRTKLHCKQIITEKDFDNYQIVDHSRFKEVASTVYATPHSQAIWTATSGSTGVPKQQRIDHNSVVLQTQRLCKHLNFQRGTSSLHTNNLHHGASACYHFLPSMMIAKHQWILNSHFASESDLKNLSDFIIDKKINKLFLYTPSKLTNWLNTTSVLQHPVDVTTLYYCPKDMISLAKQKNVSSIKSVFGDTTIGYGFLVKTVDCSEPLDAYEPNCIGPKLDNFFDFDLRDQSLYVQIPGVGSTEWKTSHDKFELRDGKYYFMGRGTDYRINDEWILHQEIEAKVSELFDVNHEEGATIVVDNEEQQVYLAIWINNPEAESELDYWFQQRYRSVYISKRARDLNKKDFMGARKISRPALREHFRINVPRLANYTENPWILS
jgi:acyl-coenzyme A synthetase/AMP-(fatty) acid ligase